MRAVDGERRFLPRPLTDAVVAHARDLNRQVASDELFLLALAGLDGEPPARRALEAEGVTAERLRPEIRVEGDEPAAAWDGLTFSPAYYTMHGRAEGLAASLGDGTITPEHVLLALLWDGGSSSSQLLWRLGVSRERLVERLGDLGVPVPPAPLPPQHEIEWGEPVWFDRDQVRTVLEHVRSRVPPHSRWGFNYSGDRAWVGGQADIDFDALVREALPPASEARAIDHVQLAMPAGREDEAEAFYGGLLGLSRVPSPQGCAFERGAVRVHLGVDDGFRPALLYRRLAPLADRLRGAGVEVSESERVDGGWRVLVADPFGNRLELVERGGTLPGPP